MANTNPPKRGQAFTVDIVLEDRGAPGSFIVSPTIVAGDFQVQKDGGGYANLTNLPTVSGRTITLALTATEMTADVVDILGVDISTVKTWSDFFLCILTTA